MWLKKELMNRVIGIEKELVALRGEIERQQGMLVVYRDVVEGQRKHIEKLLDRAMSRELKEFKTFSLPEMPAVRPYADFNPLADEELAGRIVGEGELDGDR